MNTKAFKYGLGLVLGLATTASHAQVLFSDDFDTDSAGDWIVLEDSLSETPDATVTFAHDYTQDSFQVTRGATTETMTVPKNPFDSGDSTLGLKLVVNSDDEAAESSVSLFPANFSVDGDYAIRFELFMSYNGPAYGGSGSTEFTTMGVGQSAELVGFLDGNAALDGDGVFFAVSGEGGASRDFRAYVGDGFSEPEFLDEQGARVGFTDMDGDGVGEYNAFVGGPLERVFAFPPHETEGAPGKGWVRVEVRSVGGEVSWIMNGQIIATIASDTVLTGGNNVMIGYSDPFSSIADPGEENFAIIDNFRVVQLGAGEVPSIVGVTVDGAIVFDEEAAAEVFKATPAVEGTGTVDFVFTRTGSTDEALTVPIAFEGTAQGGRDYEAVSPAEVTFAAGEAETTLSLQLIDDEEEELDETIEVIIESSAAYETAAGKFAVVPLQDNGDVGLPTPDLLEGAEVVFSEDFESDVSSDWTVNRSSDDTTVTFGYDYAIDGIPSAPNSGGDTTFGLKFTANEFDGVAAHITASPNGQSFSGDYVLTFDLWLNFNGPIPGGGSGSTEFAAAGLGTSGDHIQVGDDSSDGAWFIVTGDGGSSRDYRFFLDNLFLTEDSEIYLAGSQDNGADYYASIFPEGKSAPEFQTADFNQQVGTTLSGQPAFEWVPVQLAKVGDTVTWTMKGTDIVVASQATAPFSDSGNIFVGYSDWFASVSDNPDLSFGLFDNLKVYQLSEREPVELSLSIAAAGTGVILEYAGTLESASSVTGPWTAVEGATSPFETTVDAGATALFYRVVE